MPLVLSPAHDLPPGLTGVSSSVSLNHALGWGDACLGHLGWDLGDAHLQMSWVSGRRRRPCLLPWALFVLSLSLNLGQIRHWGFVVHFINCLLRWP